MHLLEKLLLRKGISAESTLDVEYIPAVGPPSDEATGAHEDWVSAVDGGWAPAVATGCYDGAARLYLPSGKLACELTAGDGSAPITAVTLLPPEEGASGCVLVAGGHDGVVRSWSVSEKFKQTAAPRLFVGHAGAVSAVAAAPGGESSPLRATTEPFACGAAKGAWRNPRRRVASRNPRDRRPNDVKPPMATPCEAGANRRASNLPPNRPSR